MCVVVVVVQGQDCHAVGVVAVVNPTAVPHTILCAAPKSTHSLNLPKFFTRSVCARVIRTMPQFSQDQEFRIIRRCALLRTARELLMFTVNNVWRIPRLLYILSAPTAAHRASGKAYKRVPSTRRNWRYHCAAVIQYLPRTHNQGMVRVQPVECQCRPLEGGPRVPAFTNDERQILFSDVALTWCDTRYSTRTAALL